MTLPLHVVEPTLADRTGHCYSHVLSLLEANRRLGLPIHVWADRAATGLFPDQPGVAFHAHFRHSLRRPQTFLLYRRLLRQPGRIYIPTGTRTDLLLLNWAARGTIPERKAYLLFHWLKLSQRKRRQLGKLAGRQPHVVTLAPTAGMAERLTGCGFRTARAVPYPITPIEADLLPVGPSPFRYVLSAGAAREDKGFSHVVRLVEFLADGNSDIPVLVQTSPPHTGTHEPAVAAAMARLNAARFPHLQLRTDTLAEDQYYGLFPGSICLQLYDPHEYAADRLSGVTLDALSCGSPVIATAGTWMAKVAERFNAGVAVDTVTPESVHEAVRHICANFAVFEANARDAGRVLQDENDATHILKAVTD